MSRFINILIKVQNKISSNDLKWYWKLLVRMIWNDIDIAMCYNLLLPVIDFCGVIIFALSTQPLKQTSARDK